MTKTLRLLAVAAGAAVAVLHAPPATATPALTWRDCDSGVQCAELSVPADHANPRGSRFDLALARYPAKDPATRLGSIVVNPGGPGAYLHLLPQLGGQFAELTQWFDVVLFDPRGMGRSAGITCPTGAPIPLEWAFPDEAAYRAQVARSREFGAGCAEAAGPLAGKLDSRQVAHDLDAIRAALGESKLRYLGNSYGTVFGQAYLSLFPHRSGRFFLDSVYDHTNRSQRDWVSSRAEVAERNLHRFGDWCARTPDCALHGRDLVKVWTDLVARAERQPIPAPGAKFGGPGTAARIVSSTHSDFERDWPRLAQAIAEADAGDASKLVGVPEIPVETDVNRQINCADFPYATDYREVSRIVAGIRATVAPLLGWRHAWVNVLKCAGLPEVSGFAPQPIPPAHRPPALLADGIHDSVTTVDYGRRVTAQLPGSRHIAVVGGHANYLYAGNHCLRGHVHRYLTTGALPPAGLTCPANT
ncbi:alpha/beta hydrolase [Crossiella sp. SN42]|uniref:alpha/beta fold hydrolase n=1 Tax=Crossiella sp. SN42 TaxID=2944808 RepID=UPI00207CAE29|nr:alpha/beta fold hydrolase [Crossiella sp. SN42]MCO1580897.1 alpha/beta hydrolase [Crossiella sp. SN42]